jgi:Flp pilus assembly protein TadG
MSPTPHLRRRARGLFESARGVALIEFALVLPFLLLIVFGMIDLGKAVSYWNDETHLANQTARYAAVNSCAACGGQTINDYNKSQAETKELADNATLTIAFADTAGKFPGETGYNPSSLPPKNHCVGQSVRVVVSYDYNLLSFVSDRIHWIGPIHIRASSTQRLEKNWSGDPSTGTGLVGTDKYDVMAGSASADTC